ncbi:response regulator [Novosphingobium flavum]|uniref:protein-glutamate methylesterase n=1 Tax=Novosphingobium flavum TaxID=1778672 RepID=A0A7X1KLI1_9SPHN|nr:chemotaxis protein CheB [Novosphingobium flavum]MBC2665609.1 response regulator [Novosphingobium flavum]
MHEARVLVVDDSAAMRALFSDLLDQAKDVVVVGTAANADEAREQIAQLRPNVLTLDVEMPGMSGIEFLEEIMESKPMPVVMLSSLTQSGTEVSLRAYELGAVECFPKPLKATPEQFTKTVGQLGKIVLAAANSNVKDARERRKAAPAKPAASAAAAPAFDWNGRVLALSASMGGIDALTALFSEFPADCPPTAVVLQAEHMVAEAFINRMSGQLACTITAAADGAALTQGTIHVAADPAHHMVLEAGTPPRLRLVARDPVDGARPSATLLYGTMARAGAPAVAAVLTGMGEDGAKGLKMLKDAGAATFAQDPGSATVGEAPAAAIAAGGVQQHLPLDQLASALLSRCSATGTWPPA